MVERQKMSESESGEVIVYVRVFDVSTQEQTCFVPKRLHRQGASILFFQRWPPLIYLNLNLTRESLPPSPYSPYSTQVYREIAGLVPIASTFKRKFLRNICDLGIRKLLFFSLRSSPFFLFCFFLYFFKYFFVFSSLPSFSIELSRWSSESSRIESSFVRIRLSNFLDFPGRSTLLRIIRLQFARSNFHDGLFIFSPLFSGIIERHVILVHNELRINM